MYTYIYIYIYIHTHYIINIVHTRTSHARSHRRRKSTASGVLRNSERKQAA